MSVIVDQVYRYSLNHSNIIDREFIIVISLSPQIKDVYVCHLQSMVHPRHTEQDDQDDQLKLSLDELQCLLREPFRPKALYSSVLRIEESDYNDDINIVKRTQKSGTHVFSIDEDSWKGLLRILPTIIFIMQTLNGSLGKQDAAEICIVTLMRIEMESQNVLLEESDDDGYLLNVGSDADSGLIKVIETIKPTIRICMIPIQKILMLEDEIVESTLRTPTMLEIFKDYLHQDEKRKAETIRSLNYLFENML